MNIFEGKLGLYKIIKTDDNTETVWSEYFDEACHNLSGAKEETLYNYIQGCELKELALHHTNIHVLDIGFGVGMGLTCLIEFINNHHLFSHQFHYTSIELDGELAKWTLKTYLPQIKYEQKNEDGLISINSTLENLTIKIFLGDGRETLPSAFQRKLIPPISAIFQDPFSPKKNPALWTVEWFSFLKNFSQDYTRMATYSSSISIRKSMIKAGWAISNHKGFGEKRTMTRACLTGNISPELLDQLARSPSKELIDSELN